jgi:hypothetical protein
VVVVVTEGAVAAVVVDVAAVEVVDVEPRRKDCDSTRVGIRRSERGTRCAQGEDEAHSSGLARRLQYPQIKCSRVDPNDHPAPIPAASTAFGNGLMYSLGANMHR